MGKSSDVIFESSGYFWWVGEETPEGRFAPRSAMPGTLTILDNGMTRLVVTGSLIQSNFLQLDRSTQLQLDTDLDALKERSIAGKVYDDRQCVYLRQIAYRGASRTIDHKTSENFEAAICLVGNAPTIRNPESFVFSRLSIELTDQEGWLRNDAMVVDVAKADEKSQSQRVSYTAEQRDYDFEEGAISLRTDIHCDACEGIAIRKIDFEQHDWIDYSPSFPQSPEQLKQEFGHIEEYLALLSGSYYALHWPLISSANGDAVDSYTLYFLRNQERTRPLEGWTLWTILPQVRDKFGSMYASWRKRRREAGTGFYLHLAALRNSSMYIEHRFVNLIWGIESLHRTLYPDAKGPSSDRSIIEALIAKLKVDSNSDQRRWLKQQLQRDTEPTLQDRIIQTFETLPWDIDRSSLNSFAEKCQRRRNDISHFGGPRKDRNETYEAFLQDLLILSAALSHLYHAALLKEIDIPARTLRSCLSDMPIGHRIKLDLTRAGFAFVKERESATTI